MITRATLSTIEQGLPKYRSMLAGNSAYNPPIFESIASVVGDGTFSTVTFSSIPTTYKHLQLRMIARGTDASASNSSNLLRLNGDNGYNYTYHAVRGSTTVASSLAYATGTYTGYLIEGIAGDGVTANAFGVSVVDIVDYTSTSKYKTLKGIVGLDRNDSSSLLRLSTSLWLNTSAISQIDIVQNNAWNFKTGSVFALYGIKG